MYHRPKLYIPDMFTNLAILNWGTASQPSRNRQGMSMRHMLSRSAMKPGELQVRAAWRWLNRCGLWKSQVAAGWQLMFLAVFRNATCSCWPRRRGWAKWLRQSFFSAIPRRHESFDRKDQMIRINEKNMETRVNSLKFYTIMYIIC